jgi:hypothetical protein
VRGMPLRGEFNDENTCRPGDLDPTAGTDDKGFFCGAYSPPSRGLAAFRCTRQAGHEGQHLAGDGQSVLATWQMDDYHDYRESVQ